MSKIVLEITDRQNILIILALDFLIQTMRKKHNIADSIIQEEIDLLELLRQKRRE
jgi:hypothetical protein